MGLSDLLELRLDLTHRLVLQLLNLLQCAADHAECLRVDSCCSQDLVGLSIFSFESFLNRLELLLKDQVAQASLSMNIIDNSMEPFKQLLLFLLDVLELLQTNFILPLDFLVILLSLNNLLLFVSEIVTHSIVLDLKVHKLGYLLLDMLTNLFHLVLNPLQRLLVERVHDFTV